MVSLKQWMRSEVMSDAEMAERIGEISEEGVRKIRFGVRGPSIRVAARIHDISGGQVRPPDLEPKPKRSRTKVMSE